MYTCQNKNRNKTNKLDKCRDRDIKIVFLSQLDEIEHKKNKEGEEKLKGKKLITKSFITC